jgi:hypothetical protein
VAAWKPHRRVGVIPKNIHPEQLAVRFGLDVRQRPPGLDEETSQPAARPLLDKQFSWGNLLMGSTLLWVRNAQPLCWPSREKLMRIRQLLIVSSLGICALRGVDALADSFTGTTSAIFEPPIPTAGNVYSGAGTNSISLGNGTDGSKPNSLTLAPEAFDTLESTSFAVAGLTYFNGQTSGNTSTIELPVELTFNFSSPSDFMETFSFSFNLEITPNSYEPLSNPLNDDILTVPTAYAPQSFSSDGTNYYLKLDGFSNDFGNTIVSTFNLPESSTATSTLYAQITAIPPVAAAAPLPRSAFGGLITLGLLAGSGLVRRSSTVFWRKFPNSH